MNYPKFLPTTLFILLLLAPLVRADEIHLKNGDHLRGTLLTLSPTVCEFDTPYQATLHIKRQELLQLQITHPVAVTLHSGETLVGTLTTDQNGMGVLHSQRFGIVTVKLTEVTKIASLPTPSHLPLDPPQKETHLAVQGRGIEDTSKPVATQAPETIGQNNAEAQTTEEERRKFFLRQAAVLLKQGEQELEFAFSYANDTNMGLRTRELSLPLTMRLGLTNRLEGSLTVPVIWAENEQLPPSPVENNQTFGLGDIQLDLNYLLIAEDEQWPDVMTAMDIWVPTDDLPDPNNAIEVTTSSGYWRVAGSLMLAKSYDPAVIYGGLAYYHTFSETQYGVRLTPGKGLVYRLGMGFSINPSLMWNNQFIGIYQTETKHDGQKIPGSVREPMLFETGLSLSLDKYNFLEPSLTFGLNDEAIDTTWQLSYIRKF